MESYSTRSTVSIVYVGKQGIDVVHGGADNRGHAVGIEGRARDRPMHITSPSTSLRLSMDSPRVGEDVRADKSVSYGGRRAIAAGAL